MSLARWCFALASEADWTPGAVPEGVEVELHVDRNSRRMHPVWLEIRVPGDLYAPRTADGGDNTARFEANSPHLNAFLQRIVSVAEDCVGFEGAAYPRMIGPGGFHLPNSCDRPC
ncbi:MAG: hypothetical protein ACYCW6_26780 [Candidatus Xenobia bacterium]